MFSHLLGLSALESTATATLQSTFVAALAQDRELKKILKESAEQCRPEICPFLPVGELQERL